MGALLTVDDLHVRFRTDKGLVLAVNGVSFAVDPGETLGIVGESGSGKSVTNLAIMGLLQSPPAEIRAGGVRFDGQELVSDGQGAIRSLRGDRIAMIFQDPMTSLNPFMRVSRQLTEVLVVHKQVSQKDALTRAIAMLERVGIPDAGRRVHSYPHEFSGGMRQRVMIAMSLLCEPDLLIADEPTTALDVTIQAQILELLKTLQEERGMAIVLITHDMGVVAGSCDRTLVMYGGGIVERASTQALFGRPLHPYTRGLLASIPRLDEREEDHGEDLYSIPGLPPIMTEAVTGCPFAPRCDRTLPRCSTEYPPDRGHEGHPVHCFVDVEGGADD